MKKKMKKIEIPVWVHVLFLAVFLLFIGGFDVRLRPFAILLPEWKTAASVLLALVAAFALYAIAYCTGYRHGLTDGADTAMEVMMNRAAELRKKLQKEEQTNEGGVQHE